MPFNDTEIRNEIIYDTKNSEKSVGSLEKKLQKLIGAAAIAFATKKIFEYGQAFETTFAKASTLIDDSAVSLEGLEDQILNLSKTSGVAGDVLNESLYQALSAGIPITDDGADAMAFLERNVQLAKGGFTDLTTAVDTTTTVINAYGMGVDEINNITDILIKTQNAGKTTVDELGASLAQVIPTAAAMGVSFEQVGAAMATLTAQGTPTAQATTQLRGLLAELGKQGTKSSNILLDLTGKSFKQLQDEGMTVADVLAIMNEHAEDNNLSMLDLFSSIEAGQGALALTGDGADKFNETMITMKDGVDATQEAFDVMAATTSEQMNKAMNELKIILTEIFLAIAPLLLSVLTFINENELLVPILIALASALTLVKLAQLGLNIAMIANPIGLIIVGIGLLIAAGFLLVRNWDKVKAFFGVLWGGILDIFKGGINGIIDMLNILPKIWEMELNLVILGLNKLAEIANKIPGVDIPMLPSISLPMIPKLAEGGLAFGETLATVGDNPNAGVDPEVITPLSRLKDMLNVNASGGPQIVQLILDGTVISETVIGNTNSIMASNFGVKPN